ncbi:DUF4352 domain-containing protein [Clostridium algidicarnis]|nr:DUF4352 domain-containing protein [Clostridium algidicarnis]
MDMKIKKTITITLAFVIMFGIAIKLVSSNITNKINNMYLEKPNPKYSNSSLEPNSKIIIVPFGEVATSRHFDFKVIEASEKVEINVENNTFTPAPGNKFILIKLKVRNSSNSTIELYRYDFVLKDTSTINERYSFDIGYKLVLKILKEENDKNFTGFRDQKPGIIKYTYVLFEVPETSKLDELVFVYGSSHFNLN